MDREASGLTVAAWCKQNEVAPSTYYKWLQRIRMEACQSLPEIQPVSPVSFVKVETGKVSPVPVSPPLPITQSETGIQIRLRNADIMIPDGTNPQTIRATLLALKKLW